MNNLVIKTNNGRTLHFFEKNGLCVKEITACSNRYKVILPSALGDFSAADTGFGMVGVVCQDEDGSIVYIKEDNDTLIKTVLLNSKSHLTYDKHFVLLLHGRWLTLSYIIEYQGKNMLSFQLVDCENEPPMAVDYTDDKCYYTFVDGDFNRVFFYNRENRVGFKIFKWSQKSFGDFEELFDGELVSAINGFVSDYYLVLKKDEKTFFMSLTLNGGSIKKEIVPLEFLDVYDDLTLFMDKDILWIIAVKYEFAFAFKTGLSKISFSSQYNIFTDNKIKKIKTVINDSDKRMVECFGTVKDLVPEFLMYKDLRKPNYILNREIPDISNLKEKDELIRKLDKIEIRLKLLEEKEKKDVN